jgi:hypothetical protein
LPACSYLHGKGELKRADVTYEELARSLNEKGWEETKASIANKLSRGAFTATFGLHLLKSDAKTYD